MEKAGKIKGYVGVCGCETKNLLDIFGRKLTPLFRTRKDCEEYLRFMAFSEEYVVKEVEL